MKDPDLLDYVRYILKFYEKKSLPVYHNYHLSRLELDVFAFLSNHPHLDTARDIVAFRMIPKANVSQAVELLIQKNYLVRKQDQQDRRRIHLSITDSAAPLASEIKTMQQEFFSQLFHGFSSEECATFSTLVSRIAENALEGGSSCESHEPESI
ncbi:MAG: MarR family transcriptional regulator [Evtepia sp.]